MAGVRWARLAELDTVLLYRILRLRAAVFVIEQACVFNDLDGRDTEPGTVQLWLDLEPEAPTVTAAARLLVEPGGNRKLSRVVTAPGARGAGLAAALVNAALALVPEGVATVLDAQARLAPWYGRWGFECDGPDFWEDGILHTPMRRG